ncbi:MAG: hypothetical protein L6Q57_07580 [Alphaproteobacteria bacterium]|nr:hypothetical protein [Alphaproteobacteria bacterium]
MNRFLALAVMASSLLLTACGDEWEWKLTTSVFPYGNQRTAGSGVIYVRKVMAQEKDLKLEPVTPKAEEKKEEEKKEEPKKEEVVKPEAKPEDKKPGEKKDLPKTEAPVPATPAEKELNKALKK